MSFQEHASLDLLLIPFTWGLPGEDLRLKRKNCSEVQEAFRNRLSFNSLTHRKLINKSKTHVGAFHHLGVLDHEGVLLAEVSLVFGFLPITKLNRKRLKRLNFEVATAFKGHMAMDCPATHSHSARESPCHQDDGLQSNSN